VGRAVIIGGTGAIGQATARRLLAAGWLADLTGRGPARLPRDIAASASGEDADATALDVPGTAARERASLRKNGSHP
jgi:NAD(P)-dependent dehydrogenase (short-subunit alcohol dehydrogenase family)